MLSSVAAQNHQQILKHQNEIQVKFKRTDYGTLAHHGRIQIGRLAQRHGFDLLGVIGGQA